MIKIVKTADWHGGGDIDAIIPFGQTYTETGDEVGNEYDEALAKYNEYLDRIWPEGDVLLFAGDLTGTFVGPKDLDKQQMQAELFFQRLAESPYKVIIGCFGNHDTAFDYDFRLNRYKSFKHIQWFKNKVKQFNEENPDKKLYWDHIIKDYEVEVNGINLKVLAVPYTDVIPGNDRWSFNWSQKTISQLGHFNKEYDIIISHGPVYGYGDAAMRPGMSYGDHDVEERTGTKLFDKFKHKPKMFVSGHIHGGYGVYEGKDKWEGTTFYCCSHLDDKYQPVNKWMVTEFEK